jgi:hypothetical protein
VQQLTDFALQQFIMLLQCGEDTSFDKRKVSLQRAQFVPPFAEEQIGYDVSNSGLFEVYPTVRHSGYAAG